MSLQMLEPAIVKRVQQVSDENCADSLINCHVDKFVERMEEIKPFVSEEFYLEVVMDMESIMNLVCFLSEDGAYRKGLMDGFALQRDMIKIADRIKISNEKSPL